MSQTLKEKILDRMNGLSIQPKRSLGQNFLVSSNVVHGILEAAQASQFDHVYEIGPGLGALTDDLKEQSSEITLIEFDRVFSQFWRDKNLNVIEIDALKMDWDSLPWNHQKLLLVSNLPYQISSRLVVEFSMRKSTFDRMVLMFQKEVAQRIQALPGTSEYGLLSVVAQLSWQIHLVLEAGSVDFFPKPKVASRVLCFNKKEVELDSVVYESFLKFLKLSFQNRRKKLLPKLIQFQSKDVLKQIFEELKLAEDVRAEKLDPKQFLLLYFALKKEY